MELGVPKGGGVECFIQDSHEAIFRTLDDNGGGAEGFI